MDDDTPNPEYNPKLVETVIGTLQDGTQRTFVTLEEHVRVVSFELRDAAIRNKALKAELDHCSAKARQPMKIYRLTEDDDVTWHIAAKTPHDALRAWLATDGIEDGDAESMSIDVEEVPSEKWSETKFDDDGRGAMITLEVAMLDIAKIPDAERPYALVICCSEW